MKKARCCSEDPYFALLALRTTPKANTESPAFILMKRNPRTLLPRIAKTVNKSNTDHKFSKPKELSPLEQNQNVRVLQDNLWKREGVVVKALPYRYYKIQNQITQWKYRQTKQKTHPPDQTTPGIR